MQLVQTSFVACHVSTICSYKHIFVPDPLGFFVLIMFFHLIAFCSPKYVPSRINRLFAYISPVSHQLVLHLNMFRLPSAGYSCPVEGLIGHVLLETQDEEL